MPKARAHLIVSGKVQGVFYRSFTREIAYSLGITGWTRNCEDGNVEVLFEGEKSDIEKAISSCYIGPPASRVDSINVRWEEFKNEFDIYTVRYS